MSPEIPCKSAAHLSMILNHNELQIHDPPEGAAALLSVDTSSSSSSVKRQKIEMAISELNMDEDVIRDLKDAFNCSSSSSVDVDVNVGSDAASALLGLRGAAQKAGPSDMTTGIPPSSSKLAILDAKKNQKFQIRMHTYYAASSPTNLHFAHPQKIVRALPGPNHCLIRAPLSNHQPAFMNQSTSGRPVMNAAQSTSGRPFIPFSQPRPSQIRRVKEYTSFAIKLRQNEKYWEIAAYSPEFEERQVKVKLTKNAAQQQQRQEVSVTNRETETIIIEAAKFMIIRCPNGSVIEKSVSAQSVIPLGGIAVPNSISISCIKGGYIRIRIEKQK